MGWLLRNILFALVVPKALRSSYCCLAFLLFASLQEHSLRSFVYSTHLYFEASFKIQLHLINFYFVALLKSARTKKPTLFAWAL